MLATKLEQRGERVLAVDCDPNPNLAESFDMDSTALDRFTGEGGLRRAGKTLELAREPDLVRVAAGLWLLGGPPGDAPLADAVARGIAGVLIAERFDHVVTDLGAGPELTRIAVGGVLNPAELCLVLSDGRPISELTAERVEMVCQARGVEARRALNRRGEAAAVASELVASLAELP